MIGTVAESVNTKRTRVLAGAHAHPPRNGDGRNHAFQASVHAKVHQAAQVYQPFIAEDHFRYRAIQSKNANFHLVNVALFTATLCLPSILALPRRDTARW